MKKTIAVIKGDGIGPEIVQQAIKVLDAIAFTYNHNFTYQSVDMGACAIEKYGQPITEEGLTICAESDAVLLGAIGDPKYDNDPTLKVRPEQGLLQLRKALGLFCNIRPITIYETIVDRSPVKSSILEGVDMVIYRELIGGIYFGDKILAEDGSQATDTCTYSVEQIRQITTKAFEAAEHRRKKVTLVDKANVLETSRLWRKTVTEIAKEYPSVTLEYMFVDNAAMQLVQRPSEFDVILTENMFGDILSDLASVLPGSIGLLPSASVGGKNGLYEPIHGSWPQAKGMDIANPMATILATAMLCDDFGMSREAQKIREAIQWAMDEKIYSQDISSGSSYACSAIGDLIANYIEQGGNISMNRQNLEESKGIFI